MMKFEERESALNDAEKLQGLELRELALKRDKNRFFIEQKIKDKALKKQLKKVAGGARTACKVAFGIIVMAVITAVILLAVPYTRGFILKLLNFA